MQFQKITLTLASVAAASVLGCTGTHEAGATNATPDPRLSPASVQSDRGTSSSSEAAVARNAAANTTGSVAPNTPRSAADTDTTVRPKVVVGNHPTPPVLDSLIKGTLPVRGLYVFRFGANTHRLKHLIGIADSTEVNALIIDVKDEFGLNYESSDPMVKKNAGTQVKAHNLGALVDTIRAHGILPVARIVVFKDSVTARNNPNHTIRKADGTAWHDKKGQTWVNPYANAIWEYNFRVAEEAIKMGFGEIQFDYIRFPEPYKSLPPQVFPEMNGRTKQQALSEFLNAANKRIDKYGVRTTADIFGLVTTVKGALEVGQEWEPLTKSVDVLLPMVYPSHYPHGSFGIAHPNAEPYNVIHIAISSARERNAALGLNGQRVRPWLQAFTLGPPKYGAAELEEEKRAVYDSGFDSWVMWNPGSQYDVFRPAFEKTTVSRAKNPPVPAPKPRDD
jgi:hypothetical protein